MMGWYLLIVAGAFGLGLLIGIAGGGSSAQRYYNEGYADGRRNSGPRSIGGIH